MLPETIDSLPDDVKPLVLELLRQNGALAARIEELLTQNKALLSRIAELEAKQGEPPKTPDNSSLPPSHGQKRNVAEPTSPHKRHPTCLRARRSAPV
jgi:transposase